MSEPLLLDVEATAYLLTTFESLAGRDVEVPHTRPAGESLPEMKAPTTAPASAEAVFETAAREIERVMSHDYRISALLPLRLRSRWGTQAEQRSPDVLQSLRELAALLIKTDDGGWTLRGDGDVVLLARRRFPVSLLLAMRAADMARTGEGNPPDALRLSQLVSDASLREILDSGLADGHVHIGSSISFPAAFLLALCKVREASLKNTKFVYFPRAAGWFRAQILLIAAKIAYRLLDRFIDHAGVNHNPCNHRSLQEYIDATSESRWISARFRKHVQFWDEPFWALVAGDATKTDAVETSIWNDLDTVVGLKERESEDLLQVVKDRHGDPGDHDELAGRMLRRLFAYYLAHPGDRELALHLTQFVRCLCILYSSVTMRLRPGLDAFRPHFDAHGLLRKVGLSSREELVKHALHNLNVTHRLSGLELRMSVDEDTTTEIRPKDQPAGALSEREPAARPSEERLPEKIPFSVRGLAQTCSQHIKEYRAYLQDYDSSCATSGDGDCRHKLPKVVFPFTFVRLPDRRDEFRGEAAGDPTSSGRPCRWQFRRLWKAMGVVAELFVEYPGARNLFGVLDVAGGEHELANWVFALLFNELRSRLGEDASSVNGGPGSLICTFHAGESVDTPLQGLRRIHEAMEYVPWVSRIGHGLALGWSAERWPEEQNAHELLDDLVWAWGLLETDDPCGLRRNVEAAALPLARSLYGVDLTSDLLLAAYRHRFDPDRLAEVGLVSRARSSDGERRERSYYGFVERSLIRGGSWDEVKVLAHYLADERFSHETTGLRAHRKLIEKLYAAIAPRVKRQIIKQKIVIELCPTSNLAVADIPGYDCHPVFSLVNTAKGARRLQVTLNTDNPGVFHVTTEDEYASIWQAASPAFKAVLPAISTRGRNSFARGLAGVRSARALDARLTACEAELAVPPGGRRAIARG